MFEYHQHTVRKTIRRWVGLAGNREVGIAEQQDQQDRAAADAQQQAAQVAVGGCGIAAPARRGPRRGAR